MARDTALNPNLKIANPPAKITPVQQLISSCTGAIITSLFVTPLDVVKIRLQAQHKHSLHNKCFLYCNGFIEDLCCSMHANAHNGTSQSYWYRASTCHLTGTMDAFVKISRAEGVTSLWSGLPPTILMAVPATVVYYTTYDQLRDWLRSKSGASNSSILVPVIAGGSARTIAATLISPIELVRTKMQSTKLSYIEVCDAIKLLVKNQGLHSLWRGLGPTFLRDVPFSAFYWSSYEFLKMRYQQETPKFWFSFLAGATAGTIAALFTLPFDVIKTHRQIEIGEMEALASKSHSSTYSLMKNLYQRSGYKALFAGIVPRIIKVAPACAIMISSYEYGKNFFRNYNASKVGTSK